MSNKIAEHEKRKEIEGLIIDCKFAQFGSLKIQKEIKSRLGLDLSRPLIDKHYKELMNGDVLSRNIETQAGLLNMAESNDGGGGGFAPPAIDLDRLGKIRESYKKKKEKHKDYIDRIYEVRACMALLIECNFQAFIEGKERFKPEYSKHLKDLEAIIKSSDSA